MTQLWIFYSYYSTMYLRLLNLCAFVGTHLCTCIVLHANFFLLDQQWRQLAVSFYSKWYCAVSGVNLLARRSGWLQTDTLYLKVWMYVSIKVVGIKYWQVMVYLRKLMSKVFFLRQFTTNYIFALSAYNLQWKILLWKIFSYWKYIIITNQKVKILWFCMCACGCGCNWSCLREQCVYCCEMWELTVADEVRLHGGSIVSGW